MSTRGGMTTKKEEENKTFFFPSSAGNTGTTSSTSSTSSTIVVLVVLVALVVLLALVVPSFPVDLLGKSGTDDVFQTFHNRSTFLGHGEVSENTRGASNT